MAIATAISFENVSDQLLDVQENCSEVVIALKPIHYNWHQLGVYLNIPDDILKSIDATHKDDHFRQTSELISRWLRRPTPNHHPSRRVLCQALANMGEVALAEKIAGNKHEDQSRVGGCHRCTPVAVAVTQKDPKSAATELKKLFEELIFFMIKEIRNIDINTLRHNIRKYFQDKDGKVDEKIEQYLVLIDRDYNTPKAILNYLIDVKFIGYINYSMIEIFQELANSPILDVRINEYVKDYHSFLGLTFMDCTDTFQQLPDLSPEYPAGIPTFSFYLESKWNEKPILTLQEILKHCFNNSSWVQQLMITRIRRHCIIVTFAVLPHIAREVLKYLTNDDVIESMKKEGISVNISKQLIKYEELETTSMEPSLESCPTPLGLEIGPQVHNNIEIAKKLKSDFEKLLKFSIDVIPKSQLDDGQLQSHVKNYFGKILTNDVLEKLQAECHMPSDILDYFQCHGFIGYINYSFINFFQLLAKNKLLDKHIEQYEKDFQCFLDLPLSQICEVFSFPDLCPNFPKGFPMFTFHLTRQWAEKSFLVFKSLLLHVHCLNLPIDHHLMIAELKQADGLKISFAVLHNGKTTLMQQAISCHSGILSTNFNKLIT